MNRIVFAALAVGALLLGGCSASDSGKPSAAEAPAGAPGAAPERNMDTAGGAGTDQLKPAQPPGDASTTTTGSVEGRSLIYRGEITVRVEDVEVAASKTE